MKIYAISDLHMSGCNPKPMDIFGMNWNGHMDKIKADWREKVTGDDVVLICGDISWAMTLDDALVDINSLEELPGQKVFIRGNHDYWWNGISKIRSRLLPDFHVVQNDAIKIGNAVICGSRGWTVEGSPDFTASDKKLYLRETERMKMSLFAANKLKAEGDKLIVMIHYPPFNTKFDNSLFTDLFEANSVDSVVYGHLHGKESRAVLYMEKNSVKYYLSSCDLVANKLVEIL